VLFGGGKKTSGCPIGIDVGDHTVRMLQLTLEGDRHVALAAASRPLGRDVNLGSPDAYHQAVSHAVREMLSSGRFQGRHAVSCLPAASLQYKNIRLPRMPHDELASAVGWEASERLKLSSDAMDVRFFDAGEVQQGQEVRQEVILMAAPKRFIEEHIGSLMSCDLELSAIDVVPAALARCVTHNVPVDDQDPKVRVVIDVGYAGTKVLIVRGHRICFFKLIEIGGRHMDEALASKLQLPAAAAAEARRGWMTGEVSPESDARIASVMGPVVEELSREVNLCLRYYSVTFRGRRPEEALVVGGESGNAWLWAKLCEEAGLKPSPNDPMTSLDLTPVQAEVGGPDRWAGWAVALGLSLRHVNTGRRKSRGAA
jgi:type IV pilus assembly protein PilM